MTAKDERKFLHDIAGPLSNANLLLATMVKRVEKKPDTDEMLKEGINELKEIIDELKVLLDKRRDALSGQG